jgi:hypothetical protein
LNNFEIALLEKVAALIDDIFPYPFNEELRGIAEAVNADLGDVVTANIIYDLTA